MKTWFWSFFNNLFMKKIIIYNYTIWRVQKPTFNNMLWIKLKIYKSLLFKFIYNLHRWDSIQYEFKSIFIQYLNNIFLLCKIPIQFSKNCKFHFPQYDYVQFLLKKLWCYSNCNHPQEVLPAFVYRIVMELQNCLNPSKLPWKYMKFKFDKFWFFGGKTIVN
jgi:hypothetical protein